MAVIQKLRKSFGKSFLQTPLPDLVEIQYNSYKDFLQADVEPQSRKNMGLQNVFSSMFPIKDYAGIADLEFVEYPNKEMADKIRLMAAGGGDELPDIFICNLI